MIWKIRQVREREKNCYIQSGRIETKEGKYQPTKTKKSDIVIL